MKGMYKDLSDFLYKNYTKNKEEITHTRIGNESENIYGGCYKITEAEKSEFYRLYYNEIIRRNKLEYLTEKQIKDGPIAIDLDFRFDQGIDERQHT